MSLMEKPKDDRMVIKDLDRKNKLRERGIKRNEWCTLKCEGREGVKT